MRLLATFGLWLLCVCGVLETVSELVPNASIIKRADFKCHSSLLLKAPHLLLRVSQVPRSHLVGEPDYSRGCLLKQLKKDEITSRFPARKHKITFSTIQPRLIKAGCNRVKLCTKLLPFFILFIQVWNQNYPPLFISSTFVYCYPFLSNLPNLLIHLSIYQLN